MSEFKKIIGLEGLQNSGKSHILKNLVTRLSKGVNVVVYDYDGNLLQNLTDKDYIAFFNYENKYIAVATGGDYLRNVKDVENAVNRNNKDIDVLVAAMRDVSPDVKSRYEVFANEKGIPFETIFKPGFREADNQMFSLGIAASEMYWIIALETKIREN